MNKTQDTAYEDTIIEEVQASEKGEGWVITCDTGWSFFVPDNGIEPHEGDTARFYGAGIGSVVRGLDIRGQEVFYRTPEQQREENKRCLAESERKEKERFEQNKAQLDADYESLPPEFRRRLDRFRSNNPDFRWKLEGYEMMVCKEAVNIATQFPTEAEVKFFWKQDCERRKEMLPSLGDDHSANSFGAACRLALLYVHNPKLMTQEHGALCPLLGCKGYGCVPVDKAA